MTCVGADGVERPVSMKDHALMFLGRGLLVQPGWLGPAAAAWGLEERVNQFGAEFSGMCPTVEWNLNGSGVRLAGVGGSPRRGPPSATPSFLLATAFCSVCGGPYRL